jgi:hypothetical protein
MPTPGEVAIQRRVLAGLLRAWVDATVDEPPKSARVVGLLQRFHFAESDRVHRVVSQADLPVEISSVGWLRGPVIDKGLTMYPVAGIRLFHQEDGRLNVTLRVALFFEGEDGDPDVQGWRFETGEDPGQAHPLPHAQCIRTWGGPAAAPLFSSRADGDVSQLSDRPIRQVNETRPAFPLPGTSAVGMVGAMLASFYGAPRATDIVRTGLRGAKSAQNLAKELGAVLPSL